MAGGFESQLGAPVAPVPLSPTLTQQMPHELAAPPNEGASFFFTLRDISKQIPPTVW
jgi:hypothetical protein